MTELNVPLYISWQEHLFPEHEIHPVQTQPIPTQPPLQCAQMVALTSLMMLVTSSTLNCLGWLCFGKRFRWLFSSYCKTGCQAWPEASYLGGSLDRRFVGHGSCQNGICNGRVHDYGVLFNKKFRWQGNGIGVVLPNGSWMQEKKNLGRQEDERQKVFLK